MKYAQYEKIKNQINEASKSNQLVVFIGAGMSNNFGFPTWNSLVKQMYQQLTGKLPAAKKVFSSDELVRIPQLLRNKNVAAYRKILKECFGAQKVKKADNVLLDEIMKLNPKHIITTNFDTLIETYLRDKENALQKEHSIQEGYDKLVKHQIAYHYMPVINDSDMILADANHLLLKIHGDVQNMDSLVLCEDDYLGYADSHILMENFIKSLLINHTFLFIGYGVGDSNLKLIMKWVDTIVASKKKLDEEKRKKHILLYADKKVMDALQREYFERKQIQVLEFGDLPSSYKKQDAAELTDLRGKNLLRMLRAVTVKKGKENISDDIVSKLITHFENRKCIHIWEVNVYLENDRYTVRKAGTELCLMERTEGCKKMEGVIRVAGRKNGDELTNSARSFLGKLSTDHYCYERNLKAKSFSVVYDSVLEDACIVSGYIDIYAYVKESRNFSFAEKAYWALYTDNGKEAEKWLDKQWESKKKLTLYEQLQFALSARQFDPLEEKYSVDFARLWESIPDIHKEKMPVLREYISGCASLYSEFGSISDKLRLRYGKEYTYGRYYYDETDFEVCRTNILDFVRNLILNGFYITGMWSHTTSYGNIDSLMQAYADMILFLISPACRQKPEWFQLCGWDIYILLNLIDVKILDELLEKNRIEKISMNDYTSDILWENCMNLLAFSKIRIQRKTAAGHISVRRLENCLKLMGLADWDQEELQPIIESIFLYLEKVIVLDRDERTFQVPSGVLFKFLKKQYDKGHQSMIASYSENLLKKQLQKFIREDHLNSYSKVLTNNVELYAEIAYLTELVNPRNNQLSTKLIRQVWNCYEKWYSGSASYLLADIYPFADERVKKEISMHANKKIMAMNAEELRIFMDRDIVVYSAETEKVLLERCEQFSKLSKRQRGESGSSQNTLTHILRLWQNKKIPDIEVFRKYKELDLWFSFVCFPEEFDYEQFQVEKWCTWLGEERYRQKAFECNRELLKDKFEKALENGAGEDVRRIYYKYVE